MSLQAAISKLDQLRMHAASEGGGMLYVSVEDLNDLYAQCREHLEWAEKKACKDNGCTPDELTICGSCDGTGFVAR